MRRAARRDANERQIIKFLERCGASVVQLDDPSVPDLLIAWGGVNLLCEIKTKTGKLTPAQQHFFSTWKGQVSIVRSVSDAKQVLRSIHMPTYTYKCTSCQETITVVHSIFEEPRTVCPKCGEKTLVRQIVSAPTVVYKGNGWAGKDET